MFLSVTRRDKIPEGFLMVLREIWGCWQGVSKSFRMFQGGFLIIEGAEHATNFGPFLEGVSEYVSSYF